MKKNEKKLGTQIFTGILVVLALALFAIIVVVQVGASPYKTARTNAIKIAQSRADLKVATEFDIVNIDQTVYSLKGTDKDDKKIAVLISENLKNKEERGSVTDLKVVNLDDGVAENDLKDASTADYVRLGLYKNKVVWEVATSSNEYNLYDFESGERVL